MADGSTYPARKVEASRELLSSRSPHDASLMNVEQTAEDHFELVAYPRGWFTINTPDGSVDLNPQTAKLMALEILKTLAVGA